MSAWTEIGTSVCACLLHLLFSPPSHIFTVCVFTHCLKSAKCIAESEIRPCCTSESNGRRSQIGSIGLVFVTVKGKVMFPFTVYFGKAAGAAVLFLLADPSQ